MKLGMSDWGIGGLGLYELVKKARPDVGITYISDQGSIPYTMMSRLELAERVQQIMLTFRRLGVERVVFACNAASTALDEVAVLGIDATGVIEPTLRSMRTKRFREVGVIGGRRTILSGAYGRALRKQRFCVLQRISLDLSVAIESGLANTPETREILGGLLEPLVKADCVLLACTHYRLVAPTIQEILPFAVIVDPVDETAAELVQMLPRPTEEHVPDAFYTTGEPEAMAQRAYEYFNLDIRANTLDAERPELVASKHPGFLLK